MYHSRFNPECNTERGFIDSLSIALGLRISEFLKKNLKNTLDNKHLGLVYANCK